MREIIWDLVLCLWLLESEQSPDQPNENGHDLGNSNVSIIGYQKTDLTGGTWYVLICPPPSSLSLPLSMTSISNMLVTADYSTIIGMHVTDQMALHVSRLGRKDENKRNKLNRNEGRLEKYGNEVLVHHVNDRLRWEKVVWKSSLLCPMFTYLLILFSSKNRCFSSAGISNIRVSNTPLKGITIAPGSFASTHSFILTNLNDVWIMCKSVHEIISITKFVNGLSHQHS